LAHHDPEHYERCVRIGDRHVCRRCLVLYPLAFAVAAAALLAGREPTSLDAVWLLALPIPAVVEFCLEHLGRIPYRAVRQIAVTVPLAFALGLGFARYLDDPGDLLFWAMVLVYGGICVAVMAWRFLDERA
jgi:hypothetical protein